MTEKFSTITAPLLLAALLFLIPAQALAAKDWPRPLGPVGDYAHVLSPEAKKAIAAYTTELWQKTGAAVVVATVPALEGGESIEELAVHLFQQWGIGQKGSDEGLLFLISLDPRKLRIEVGYGLEGIIPDAVAARIRDQAMVPYLRKNDFDRGLMSGVAAAAQIIAKAKGVTLDGVPKPGARGEGNGIIGLVLMLVLFVGFSLLAGRRGGRGMAAGFILGSMMGGMTGGHSRGGFGGFGGGGGFGGFGGGMSGGGGASGGF